MGENVNGLLVIGDVVTDVVAAQHSTARTGTDTAARIDLRAGGSGANTAAWAAHSGAPTTLLARVGADDLDWHEARLRANGVEPVLHADEDNSTAVVLAMIDAAGERTMVTDRGAAQLLGPSDWDAELLRGKAHVHLSGYTLFSESGRELVAMVLAAARRAEVTVSVDPCSTGFLTDFGVAEFTAACAGAGVVFPNLDEATLLTGTSDPAAAARKLSQDYGIAAVTLGEQGAIVADGGSIVDYVPTPSARVVDAVGAGDAFTGAFLAAMLDGRGASAAADAGCRAGARAVTITGGRPPRA